MEKAGALKQVAAVDLVVVAAGTALALQLELPDKEIAVAPEQMLVISGPVVAAADLVDLAAMPLLVAVEMLVLALLQALPELQLITQLELLALATTALQPY